MVLLLFVIPVVLALAGFVCLEISTDRKLKHLEDDPEYEEDPEWEYIRFINGA